MCPNLCCLRILLIRCKNRNNCVVFDEDFNEIFCCRTDFYSKSTDNSLKQPILSINTKWPLFDIFSIFVEKHLPISGFVLYLHSNYWR
jgi:hypothetical protein